MTRSIVVPGWGSLVAGDIRGVGILAGAAVGLVGLVLLALPYADGTAVALVFLVGAALAIAWVAQALLAWRRAVARRATFDLPTDDGGALAVLWLAPVVIVAATVFWSLAGGGASPSARAAAYAEAWWADRPERAVDGFTSPLDPAAIEAAWARQGPRLRNALVAAAAEAGPGSGIDPDRPFESIRFSQESADGGDGSTRVIRMEIVRRVQSQESLLGIVRTTSQRLEPVSEIGRIELRLERTPGPFAPMPDVEIWRIVTVTALDETIGG